MTGRRRQLWVLAGGNGAGKSTFYRTFLEADGVEFINADLIEKTLPLSAREDASYEAAKVARERFGRYTEEGHSFCYETVFSHPSKLDMLMAAKARDYYVNLVIIHLANASLNTLRVGQRVSTGGHAVPLDKITERIPRTLALMQQAVTLADRSQLFDNSSAALPFRLVAERRDEEVFAHDKPLPRWAADILGA